MQSRAAIRYAKAMYDIASEENFINEVYKDMSLIKDLHGDSLDFKSLLSNSQINYQDKKKAILSLLENALRTQANDNFESHRIWLKEITKLYYDPLYKFKLEKKKSRIIFRGSREEVFKWLQHHALD